MKYIIFIALFLCQCFLFGQDLPLIHEETFEDSKLENFYFTDSEAWKITDGALELHQQSEYEPPFRSPLNIAILKTPVVGSFVLEVNLKQTGREYGHRDMCLFFGINNPSNFYYVHMASVADQNAHNIFLVNDEARQNIATQTTDGIKWGKDWNKVRIERDVEKGSILVFFNNMENPIMKADDKHFPAGRIGFGSFDDTGMIDNIKIWGDKSAMRSFF